jgi:hypothetical protein
MTGPPDPRKSRGQILRTWPRKFLFDNQKQAATSANKTQDRRIERYLTFLSHEIDRLRAGFISEHRLRCAKICWEYQSTRSAGVRVSCCQAIRTCSQWLAQLRGGAS